MNSSKKSHKVKLPQSEVKIREGRIAEGSVTLVYRSRVWEPREIFTWTLHMNMDWKCRHEKVGTKGEKEKAREPRKEKMVQEDGPRPIVGPSNHL